jgi:fumarylacetoacetate (FAA) hydrolase
MKFATLRNGRPDGRPVLVSRDLRQAAALDDIAPSLLELLAHWSALAPTLETRYAALNAGRHAAAFGFDAALAMAPLPRAPQWCDGSAFLHHGRLMERAFNTPPIPGFETEPVLYQGASDDFLGARDTVALPDEAHGIDFEGEFGAILDSVPMGMDADAALQRIRLLVQINDWSLRALGPREMQSGFGFVQAKPSTSFAPVAVTPDELGPAWKQGRVHLRLQVDWNGRRFGQADGGSMHFHFGELIAHAARTRRLSAGTIIGSGTVSNPDPAAGCSCIAERRVLETLEHGAPRTAFMRFGDRVRMQALATPDDGSGLAPFGAIDQQVVQAPAWNADR